MKISFKFLLVLFALVTVACVIVFPQRAEANLGETFYGVEITRDANYVSYNNVAFPFNQKRFGLDTMWSISDPTKITIPVDGAWLIGYDMTALGLLYTCSTGVSPINAERTIYEVTKNWCGNEGSCPHLHADVLFNRFELQNNYGANGNSSNTIVSLAAGDYLQLVTTGKYNGPNGTPALCIESNPLGSGKLSPHFYAYYLGSLP